MATVVNTEVLTQQITYAIDEFIKSEAERFVEKAMADYEVKLREIVAKAALKIAKDVDFMSMEDRLRIEVRIK